MEETTNYANAHADVIAKSINRHEKQDGRSDLIPYHNETNNSITHPMDTDFKQIDDVFTPPDISNNIQIFDGSRISSRGRI